MAAEEGERKRDERKKGTPTVSWQTALAGTSTGSGSQSGIEAGIGVGVPNARAAGRAGSRGAGGDGAQSLGPSRGGGGRPRVHLSAGWGLRAVTSL